MAVLLRCLLLCAALGISVDAHRALRNHASAHGFVQALDFNHRIRICNAYPFAGSLSVTRGKDESLTGNEPLPYKACKDFVSSLKAGDKLNFKIGDAGAGTFAVADLPNSDAMLLLVVHRHDIRSTSVSFESHVFANLKSAQVAIIDTYKGSTKAIPRIMDAPVQGAPINLAAKSRSEELSFDSVVAVNPGKYEIVFSGADGMQTSKGELVALDKEIYVVLRTGVEADKGQAYPQELVVFPMSDATALAHKSTQKVPPNQSHSGSRGAHVFGFAWVAVAAAAFIA